MHMKSTPETTIGKVLLIDIIYISLRETGQRQYKFQTRGFNG